MANKGVSQELLHELKTELTQQRLEQMQAVEKLLHDELEEIKKALLIDFTTLVVRPELTSFSERLRTVVREEVASSRREKHISLADSLSRSASGDPAESSDTDRRRPSFNLSLPSSHRAGDTDIRERESSQTSAGARTLVVAGSQAGAATCRSDTNGPAYKKLSQDLAPRANGQPKQRASTKHLSFSLGSKRRNPTDQEMVADTEERFSWQVFVQGGRFHFIVCSLIILYCAMLGMEADHSVKHFKTAKPRFFQLAELTFLITFIFEILLRFAVYGCELFSQLDANLTLLDIAAISLQITATLISHFSSQYEVPINFLFLRVFRLSRTLNMMHVTQDNGVANLFAEMRMLLTTLVGSMRSLVWVTCFVVLLTYILSIYIMKIVADHWKLNPEDAHAHEEDIIRSLYGTLFQSMLTLYQVLTSGLEWRGACQPLMSQIPHESLGVAFAFVVYVSFTLFVLLNTITGLFLNVAQDAALEDKKRIYQEEIRRTFEGADLDGSGDLTYEELDAQIHTAHFKHCLKMLDLHEDNAMDLFDILDDDRSGTVSHTEFVSGCIRLSGFAKAIDFAAFRVRYEEDYDQMEHLISLLHESLRKLHDQVLVLVTEGL